MYAVIDTGSHQHVVKPGDRIVLNRHEGEVGKTVTFDKILMVAKDDGKYSIGTSKVEGATVTAKVLSQGKGDKVLAYKYRRRKNYHRLVGHRQPVTELEITTINA